jgi:hypothetical protein
VLLGNKQNLGGEQIEGSFVTVGTELDAVGADVVIDDLALLGLLLRELLVADLPRSGLQRVNKDLSSRHFYN